MTRAQGISSLAVTVLVAIGCGGAAPPDASATGERESSAEPGAARIAERGSAPPSDAPIRLAQAPAGAAPAASGPSGMVRGAVHFQGAAPESKRIQMAADPVCQQQRKEPIVSEAVVVNANGTLKNVLVYVKEGISGSFPAPTEPVILDQSGCWYTPHVFGLQVHQPLQIVNSDPTLHNVNVKPQQNRPFNLAQPVQGMKMTKTFAKPEIGIPFKCNVHPWMNAYAGVFEHPFFSVSDATGAFTIEGLPAGAYVIEAWHEVYGAQSQTVSVGEGETATAAFTFSSQ
jgi:hypothetical protein